MPKHTHAKRHTPHGRDRRPQAPSRWRSSRGKKRLGGGTGYYSTMFHRWSPTNARRRGVGTGGYERTVTVDE